MRNGQRSVARRRTAGLWWLPSLRVGAVVIALFPVLSGAGVCRAQEANAAVVPVPQPPPTRWMPIDLHAHPDTGPVSQEFLFDYMCLCLPVSATYNFGDGTPPVTTRLSTTHTYAAPGTYTATLTLIGLVEGGNYAQGTDSVVVTVQPDYFFVTVSATPNMGFAPLSVTFAADLLGGTKPFTYKWDFGDGSTGSGAGPSHTYDKMGTYTARLVVTDSKGRQAGAGTTVFVGVGTISITTAATPTSGFAPLGVFYSAAATGGKPPYTFTWNFSDGTSATGATTSHTYPNPGTYTVMLQVMDSNGNWTVSGGPAVNVYPNMPPPPMP